MFSLSMIFWYYEEEEEDKKEGVLSTSIVHLRFASAAAAADVSSTALE